MKNDMKGIALVFIVMLAGTLGISAKSGETAQSQTAPSQTPPGQSPETQAPPPQNPPSQSPPAQNPPSQNPPAESAAPQTAPAQPQTAPAQNPPTAVPPTPYKPKFPGDPARSESESQALGYMRVVLRAEQIYKKRHDKYAQSLAELAGTGSFTKRMARSTERGDYKVGFRTHKDGFILVMTPKQMDPEHRSFYAEEDSIIHGDDQKAADASSPRVK
jgi:hypothetical protein